MATVTPMTRDEMIRKLQRVSVRLAFIPAADLRSDVMAVIAALATPAPVAAPPADLVATCEWSEDANGEWHTGCGTLFVFDTDGPTENKFGWCYHCGKPLAPVPFLLPEVPK